MEVKEESIEQGFNHLETLAQLHFHKSPMEQMEAMTNVMASFGMDERAIVTLSEKLTSLVPDSHWAARGWVLIGYVAGLSTAQNAAESE